MIDHWIRLARAGESARDWYRDARCAVVHAFGPRDAPVMLALLAATSPRMTVRRNVEAALTCLEAGGCVPPAMRSHGPNVARALGGERLSGPKVSAFAAALQGDEYAVAIDAWMLRIFGRPSPRASERDVRECQLGVELVARTLEWTPAETQAAMWHGARGDGKRNGACYASVLRELGYA